MAFNWGLETQYNKRFFRGNSWYVIHKKKKKKTTYNIVSIQIYGIQVLLKTDALIMKLSLVAPPFGLKILIVHLYLLTNIMHYGFKLKQHHKNLHKYLDIQDLNIHRTRRIYW